MIPTAPHELPAGPRYCPRSVRISPDRRIKKNLLKKSKNGCAARKNRRPLNIGALTEGKAMKAIFVALASVLTISQGGCQESPVKPILIQKPDHKAVVFLDQGWSREIRQDFYHKTQGAKTIPYEWFLALEQKDTSELFRNEVNMERFGFIADEESVGNPDGLPVGFAKTIDPLTKDVSLGLTCAACHTGQLRYQGKLIRIDGGPSMHDSRRFTSALIEALAATLEDPQKQTRFAKVVLKQMYGEETQRQLLEQVTGFVGKSRAGERLAEQLKLYPLEWGPGRIDALGRGGNLVLAQLDPTNLRPASGPVSLPAVWSVWDLDWVQWNGSIHQPLGRNLGQAIGVNAPVVLVPGPDQFRTTINIADLDTIEQHLRQLKSPVWPVEIFGKLNEQRIQRGQLLYTQLCAHCHVPELTPINNHGKRFLSVTMVPLEEIGTDAVSATNFNQRRAKTGVLDKGELSAAEATAYITEGIRQRQYQELGLSLEKQNEMDGYRPNMWRAPLAYIARPHHGVWTLALSCITARYRISTSCYYRQSNDQRCLR